MKRTHSFEMETPDLPKVMTRLDAVADPYAGAIACLANRLIESGAISKAHAMKDLMKLTKDLSSNMPGQKVDMWIVELPNRIMANVASEDDEQD